MGPVSSPPLQIPIKLPYSSIILSLIVMIDLWIDCIMIVMATSFVNHFKHVELKKNFLSELHYTTILFIVIYINPDT